MHSAPKAKPMNFRTDINGLRAWAVATVVLYHFGVTGFSGGFIGVDIFFVISGFLMSQIIITGIERQDAKFSVMTFYLARARRIIPALLVLCATLLVLGWFFLLPLDYRRLSTHILTSALFLSNFKYWKESGYFDSASHEKWLLHTWSLSVEWQFYLLLPIVLITAWRIFRSRNALTYLFILGFLISLGCSIFLTNTQSSTAFYLIPTRAWEMLAGGLVFLAPKTLSEKFKIHLESAGIVLIVTALTFFDTSTQWPGWKALVPVLGTILVLLAQRGQSAWTGLGIAQWLGTRSYSLYLWHWPIVVLLTYLGLKGNVTIIVMGLLATLALGHLSFRFVEEPSRKYLSSISQFRGGLAITVCAILVGTTSLISFIKDGFPGRFPAEIESVERAVQDRSPRGEECLLVSGIASPSCMFGGSNLSAIVLGDSHADAIVSAVSMAASQASPQNGVMELTYSACPIILGVKSSEGKQCGEFVEWAIRKLATLPRDVPVIIANRHAQFAFGHNEDRDIPSTPQVYFSTPYSHPDSAFLNEYAKNLTKTICEISKLHPTYIVRPIPEMGVDVPNTMARNMLLGRSREIYITRKNYDRRQSFIWEAQNKASEQCGAKILDPLPYLCTDDRCFGERNNRPIYRDDDHLSETGNKLLTQMFAPVFTDASKDQHDKTAKR